MFFQEFIKNPTKVGSLFPSSLFLASQVAKSAHLSNKGVIVEFGAGTGVFTKMICDNKKKDSTFLSFEISDDLYKIAQNKCPKANLYKDSAIFTQKYLQKHGYNRCDCIISSLPFSLFGRDLQDDFINVIDESLAVNGVFVTFMYLHSIRLPLAKSFIGKLKEYFPSLKKSSIIWKNFPPAYIFIATRNQ